MVPDQRKRLSVEGARVMGPRSSFLASATSLWMRFTVIYDAVNTIGYVISEICNPRHLRELEAYVLCVEEKVS